MATYPLFIYKFYIKYEQQFFNSFMTIIIWSNWIIYDLNVSETRIFSVKSCLPKILIFKNMRK